ncbi:MAG: DUF1109 domain-containing protein [Betaproteobacteria bacterium]|nr:DUF1109 domain-containing protein [Betaproteobacteria bacterium]
MHTEQLIDMLARDAGPAPRAVVARRLLPVMLMGVLCSVVLALWLIGPLPAESFQTPAPWVKLAYAAALAVGAGLLTSRLARPVAELFTPRLLVGLAVGAMALIGAATLFLTPAQERVDAVFGQTWLTCPWTLLGFSLPALAGILWAMRGLAPTRPRQAGWAGGLLAGALGAMGYALSCPESSPTFVAIWHTAGMAMTAYIGRLLGPIVLRW